MTPNQLKPHGPERGALSNLRRKCKYQAAAPKPTPTKAAMDADAQKISGFETRVYIRCWSPDQTTR